MAPDLSPDGGTTSTNSTSPALSSTLSETSSLLDVNILQQQQQQQHQTQNISTQPQLIQVVRTNHQTDQQSPGQHLKLPDQLLETNAYANKTEPLLSKNLIIMANEHKEISCSVGDENIVNPTSNNNLIVVDNKVLEPDENALKPHDNEDDFKPSNNDEKDNVQSKNPNLSVASNIANAFINLSSLSSGSKSTNGSSGVVQTKNVNVIVTQQQVTQHFMKTLSFTTSRGGIFVPNVIATNVSPQFTVHQYGLHGNPNGPAPNVTVNPNGNFNTNSNAIRPGVSNHFRLLFQQTPNINLNIIKNASVNPSPILEASLQTLSKVTSTQLTSKAIPTKTIVQNPVLNQKTTIPSISLQQKSFDETLSEPTQAQDSSIVNNDQHIRVLTPSEIMKTLPSLSSQDNICFNSNSMPVNEKNQTDTKLQTSFTQSSETSGSDAISLKNSTNSSPLTDTSECNTLSSNFVTTTKATMSSNNAHIQMVSG